MGVCINHPDRETAYRCSKHDIYMCEACLQCRDPELYCKYRESCSIWFLTQKITGLDEDRPAEKKSA